MATINPSSILFNYKQYEAAPTNILVQLTQLSTETLVLINNVPSWLKVVSETLGGSLNEDILFTIDTVEANLLTEGNYTAVIEFVNILENPPDPNYPTVIEGHLTVNLNLTASILLDVSLKSVSFTHTVGAAVPDNKLIQVTSENNWTVAKSEVWLSIVPTTGSNNGSFSIAVDPSGLAAATHLGTVTVDDGANSIVINVSLLISEGNTTEDYLYVAPNELDFVRNIGANLSKTSIVSLNSSASWIAVASQNWLVLDKTSGSAGTDIVQVSTDITGIIKGSYVGEITFTKDNFIRKVYVSLQVNENITTAPVNGSVNYANDIVELIMSSANQNSFLQVDFNAELLNGNSVYYKKSPFIKGVSTVVIGEETTNLIASVTPPAELTTSALNLIKPISIDFTAFERDYFTAETFESLSRNTLLFLNGKTPKIENQLSYMPAQITVSNKAVVVLNVFSLSTPTEINLTGAITDTVAVSLTNSVYMYTAIVNLAEYNLKELDVVTAVFGTQQVEIRIKKTPAESLTLSFENEWQLPEFIEITGEISIASKTNFTKHTLQIGNTTHQRIVEATPGTNFTLYTGFFETPEEVLWLSKINDTKRCFLYVNNERIEVIPTFKTIEIYKTRKHQKSYKLTFEKAVI